jgi:hypothetical protein
MKHFAISIIVLTGCGAEPAEPIVDPDGIDLTYNELSENFRARGKLMGEEVDIQEVTELHAVREYAAPVLAGTEDAPEPEPDVARARLVSIEVKGMVMRDGQPYELELDIESPDLASFGTGTLTPSPPLTIEFQLENEDLMVALEDGAMSGTVEIKKYVDEGGLDENEAVRVGGRLGGVFDVVLSNGDELSGAFFSSFDEEPEIDVE